ncbi:unnamed protein product [Camellia sinensis]
MAAVVINIINIINIGAMINIINLNAMIDIINISTMIDIINVSAIINISDINAMINIVNICNVCWEKADPSSTLVPSSTSATSTTTVSTLTTTTTTAEPAASSTTASAGLGLVDGDVAPVKILTIHFLDSVPHRLLILERHEPEPLGSASLTVVDDTPIQYHRPNVLQCQSLSPDLFLKSHSTRKRSFLARNTTSTQPSSNGYPSPPTPTTQNTAFPGKTEADGVVIGSGIAGLSQDLEKYASLDAAREWRKLLDAILPMSAAAMALPPLSIRGDWGVLSTAATRYAPSLLKSFAHMGPQGALSATKLLRPFSEIVDSLELKEPFIRNWIDLLAFLLAGVKSNGILSAEMVYMFTEWYKPGCNLEYPIHGTRAVVDALVCGLQKFGGRNSFKSHVENIVVENGRAVGFVCAKKAVVSNGISEDLKIHHIVVNDWERGVDADQNVVLISIPSVLSPDLAPPGKHVLHAYMPGTEPFGLWEGLDRKSAEYKELKSKRSEVLWRVVERAVGPGFDREKCEVKLVGTPLTHQRFLWRNRGTYGPAIQAGKGTFPGHSTPIPQLYCCGDSTFPGIGVPAVAASGAIVANSLVSVSQHSELLDAVRI